MAKKKGSKRNGNNVPQTASILKTIGQQFMLRRVELKLMYKDVAEKSKVTTVTLANLEKGKLENISMETLYKVASALRMELVVNVQNK